MIETRLLLFCGLILMSACTKHKDNNHSGGIKLYRVLFEGKITQEFDYNEDGKVTRQTFYGFNDKKSSETIYIYDLNKRLVKTESFFDVSSSMSAQQLDSGYTDFIYGPDGRLSEEIAYREKDGVHEFASKTIPTYNADGRIASRLQLSIDNKPFNLYKYEYSSRGNVIVQETFQYSGSTPKLAFRSTYEHDNKKNPYLGLTAMPFSINTNNIVKHISTNYNVTPGTPVVTTTQTIYKRYSSNSFPLEVVEYGTNTYTYQYK